LPELLGGNLASLPADKSDWHIHQFVRVHISWHIHQTWAKDVKHFSLSCNFSVIGAGLLALCKFALQRMQELLLATTRSLHAT
jgi:hypothetical protein